MMRILPKIPRIPIGPKYILNPFRVNSSSSVGIILKSVSFIEPPSFRIYPFVIKPTPGPHPPNHPPSPPTHIHKYTHAHKHTHTHTHTQTPDTHTHTHTHTHTNTHTHTRANTRHTHTHTHTQTYTHILTYTVTKLPIVNFLNLCEQINASFCFFNPLSTPKIKN